MQKVIVWSGHTNSVSDLGIRKEEFSIPRSDFRAKIEFELQWKEANPEREKHIFFYPAGNEQPMPYLGIPAVVKPGVFEKVHLVRMLRRNNPYIGWGEAFRLGEYATSKAPDTPWNALSKLRFEVEEKDTTGILFSATCIYGTAYCREINGERTIWFPIAGAIDAKESIEELEAAGIKYKILRSPLEEPSAELQPEEKQLNIGLILA